MLEEYNKYKNKLEEIYDNIAESVKVRSKISWYEEGGKSSNLFLNLEKAKAIQGIAKKFEIENKEISDPNEINNKINRFFKKIFAKTLLKSLPQVNNFFENVILKEISEKEVIDAHRNFNNNKSPGNVLIKEFYEAFWSELKEPFMNSISQTRIIKKLITSQMQAVIKLTEKKDKEKRFIKNWRPISLLNVNYKIFSKVFSSRLKKITSIVNFISTNCICS